MTTEGIYQVFLTDEADRHREDEASSQRKKLRDEMGEDLYMQYFPDEQSKAEAEQSIKDCKESLNGFEKQPRWKMKKTDTTGWKI